MKKESQLEPFFATKVKESFIKASPNLHEQKGELVIENSFYFQKNQSNIEEGKFTKVFVQLYGSVLFFKKRQSISSVLFSIDV